MYLQHLRSLALDGTLTELEPLLMNCSIQATSKIQISCIDTSDVGADFFPLVSAVRSLHHENSSNSLPFTHYVDLTIPASNSVRLASSSHDVPELAFPLYHTSIDFTWRADGTASNLDADLRHICYVHPLDDVAVLSCYTPSVLNPQTIIDVFGSLPRLQRIYPSSRAALPFLQAMTMSLSPGLTTGEPPTIAFPALRNIILDDVNFTVDSGIDADWMRDQLLERYERGSEVRELCFRNCSGLRADDIELFGKIVNDVEWDGHEQGFSEDEVDEEYDDGMYFGSGAILFDSDSDYDHGVVPGF